MKKLSVEEEVKRKLISCKYQYPAYCTTFNKLGEVVATRIVTHNLKATAELIKLHSQLATFINTYNDDEVVPAPTTVKQLLNSLGNDYLNSRL